MAGRYDDWHHLKIRGDRALAMRYLSEGRKWLGYLAEQQKLGGQQQLLEKKNADGVIFRAELSGTQPILTIDARAVGGQPPPIQVLEGFITRPSPASDQYANTDKNHVLLQPAGGGLVPWFYDPVHDVLGGSKIYGTLFPDGIGRYGNVDWMSPDGSVVLSWMGPSGRYFGYSGSNGLATAPWVFLHGQVLFDATATGALDVLAPVIADLDPPVTVRGACVRGLSWLYVVLRDDGIQEYLVRYRVVSPTMQKRAMASGIDMPVFYFADAQLDYTSGELLLTSEIEWPDGVHPYFFNGSGTEARRVYYSFSDDSTYEIALVEGEDGVTWSRNIRSTETPTATNAWEASRTVVPAGSWDDTTYENIGTGGFYDLVPHHVTDNHPSGVDPGDYSSIYGEAEIVSSSTIAHTIASDLTRMKYAVEWWNGAWHYAYTKLGAYSYTSEYANDFSSDNVLSVVPAGGGPTEVTRNLATTVTGNEVLSDLDGGVEGTFFDVNFGTFSTNTLTWTGTRDFHSYAPNSLPAEADNTEDWSWTSALERDKTRTSRDLYFNYLDLRFGVAYYQTREQIHTTEVDGNQSYTLTDPPGSTTITETGAPSDPELRIDAITRTETTQVVWTTKLFRGGALVHQIVQNDTPSTASFTDTFNTTGTTLPWLLDGFVSGIGTTANGFFASTAFLNQLGFELTYADANPLPWHAQYGDSPFTGDHVLTYSSSTATGASLFLPDAGGIGSFVDFVDDTTDGYGSWTFNHSDYLWAYQNPDERNGQPQFVIESSRTVPDLLTPTTSVRLDPVGYLSKVIVVK